VIRRVVLSLLLAAAGAVLTGCSGVDAERAKTLLAQSNRALAELESVSFNGRLWAEGDVPAFSLIVSGGGYLRGPRAGDLTMSMSVEGLPATVGEQTFDLVLRRGRPFIRHGGVWRELPAGTPMSERNEVLRGLDLTRYVKDVRVSEGPVFDGQPTDQIVGVVDTAGLVQGVVEAAASAAPLAGLPDLSKHLGDTQVTLFLSQTTHLPVRALLDLAVEADGKSIELHFGFGLMKINEPVAIPNPA
jgi:hypothetical protein